MRGHTTCRWSEASIVGALATRQANDLAMPSYRCHAQPIVLVRHREKIMAELYGRKDGLCKGLWIDAPGRSTNHFPGTSAIVGASMHTLRERRDCADQENRASCVLLLRDGSAKQGAFFETLNLAAVWKLPVVFILENNGVSGLHAHQSGRPNAIAGDPLSKKAAAFSIPGVTVDGTDR